MLNRIATLKKVSILCFCCFFASVTACTTLKSANPFLTQGERFKMEEDRRLEEYHQSAQYKEYQELDEKRKKDTEKQRLLEQQRKEEDRKAKEQAEQEARRQVQLDEEKRRREEAERWTKLIGEKTIKDCNAEIYRLQNLLIENPYDVGGKCYLLDTFSVSKIQILNRTVALLMYQNQVVYVDFGKLSAPAQGQWRSFVVKGDSVPYKYTSTAGGAVTAIKVHILKELTEGASR